MMWDLFETEKPLLGVISELIYRRQAAGRGREREGERGREKASPQLRVFWIVVRRRAELPIHRTATEERSR